MKRLINIVLAITVLTILISCSSNVTTNNAYSDDSVITIQISEEAKKYEEEVLSKEENVFSEELFPNVLQAMSGRTEQILLDCSVENRLDLTECEGSKVYTLTKENYENVVLYIHGGAWLYEISEGHVRFCDALATKLNAKVYIPLYPLVPEADSEKTYAMIEELYSEIIKEGKNVYLMGDSAGGNIALGLMHTIKENDISKPQKMVLIAPCSDMTFTNDEINKIAENDPVLELYGCLRCAEIWAGKENLKDPKNSAVYADVTGYPDTMLVQGTRDILGPDNMILYENLKKSGVNVTLVKGEGLWHVFPIYSIPEKDTVIGLIGQFCSK